MLHYGVLLGLVSMLAALPLWLGAPQANATFGGAAALLVAVLALGCVIAALLNRRPASRRRRLRSLPADRAARRPDLPSWLERAHAFVRSRFLSSLIVLLLISVALAQVFARWAS